MYADAPSILRVEKAGHSYVRDPQETYSGDLLSTTYQANSALPDDAVDTGYFRGDRRLWLAADKLAAYVVTPENVERWPALTGQAGCA